MISITYNEGFFIGNNQQTHLTYNSYKLISNSSKKVIKSLQKSWSNSCLNLASDTTRVSFAYKKLHHLPNSRVTRGTQILDLSHNKIRDLSILSRFTRLNSLILDYNKEMDLQTFPRLPNLRLLWLNNCNIMNLSCWITKIRENCPKIQFLSIMENPGNSKDDDTRSAVIRFLPMLEYLDDRKVTKRERIEALRNEKCHLVEESESLKCNEKEKCFNETTEESEDEEFITFKSTSYPG
ncbi:uncharacterized protein LOC134835086 [Culicoides brevitarsis]|uniref:uncharacterized protein LOC134835086 n=1 Tax=Culicoides brevitarsis TaxID=469753 RepID=UPI00307B8F14